jgi:nucleoside-diphosphate-sugar epimerase
MKVLILGNDGYIGYPLTLHLLKLGHDVFGVDNYSRRKRVSDTGSDSLTPILSPLGRRCYLKNKYKNFIDQVDINLGYDQPNFISQVISIFQPDSIVHLAEQPSAPWSMKNVDQASFTQAENIIGTLHLLWAIHEGCPKAHLIKLGTMGEYGTPNCDIPEGRIPNKCLGNYSGISGSIVMGHVDCPMSGLLFPRTAGSFYHLSKVMDTFNIEFACRNWGLCSTDIMQGVVFGLNRYDCDEEITRFDYDESFGTAINRFCAQAIINYPITVYGIGKQTRGFLTLQDSIQCLTLAINNPPTFGEYRTLNQFESIYSINSLADMVATSAAHLGLSPQVNFIPNPRKEAEDHYYNPDHQKLFDLGYRPTTDIQTEITKLIRQLLLYRDRVRKEVIYPTITWV